MTVKNTYTVEAFGERYRIVSDEPHVIITQAIDRIHQILHEVEHEYKGHTTDAQRKLILVALRLAHVLVVHESNLKQSVDRHRYIIDTLTQELLTP